MLQFAPFFKRDFVMTRPCLTVDLNAVRQNFETVCRLTRARVCPVVKSNAYGLGAVEITRALQDAGAVYVSTAQEGAELRGAFSDLQINVLNGIDGDSAALFAEKRLTPVISSVEQAKLWDGGFVLNVETGFNRLGVRDYAAFKGDNRVSSVMTHLSCAAEDLASPAVQAQNAKQFAAFENALSVLNPETASLGLDAFLIKPETLKVGEVRTGAALFGINVFPDKTDLKPVLTLTAPVVQVETVDAGDSVGYGATWTAKRKTKIAVAAIGYANGIPRTTGGTVFFKAENERFAAPVVGRISMGLLTCDATGIPDSALAKAYLLDDLYTINDLSRDSGRLDTEIMCSFSGMVRSFL